MFKNIKLSWYQVFKYTIFILLANNVYLFLLDDLTNTNVMFSNGISLKNIIIGFSGTIDTAAWVILLIIFELETYVIDDDKLKGKLKWFLKTISAICYLFIMYSFYGYVKKYLWFFNFEASTEIITLCNHIGESMMTGLDEYLTISLGNCKEFTTSSKWYAISNENIITNTEGLKSAKRVALIDVFNSLAWLIVVVVLEFDVWLQLKDKDVGSIKKISNSIKIIAYSVLVVAAISWGVSGIFLDTWDALLWILAFVFIEMNMFEWEKEINKKQTDI